MGLMLICLTARQPSSGITSLCQTNTLPTRGGSLSAMPTRLRCAKPTKLPPGGRLGTSCRSSHRFRRDREQSRIHHEPTRGGSDAEAVSALLLGGHGGDRVPCADLADDAVNWRI